MKRTLILSLFLGALALSAYSQAKTVSPAGAKELLANGGGTILLDVRTREEYAAGRIPGSILLPYDQIDASSASRVIGSKDRTVIVYCRSGRRSSIAAASLAALGYRNVFDLGAISSWPYGIVKGEPGKP